MGDFLHKYNTDNVHSRGVIVGLLNLLNSKVYFENVLSDTVIDPVYVPFFYNMGGDERFLQDYFTEWNDCINPRHADGNYDVIPRGIVTMTSKTIDTGKLTHRFVRGTYVKEVNGELQTYSAYINSLPISMNFDVEIDVDSNLDAFKIEQTLIETFYKNQVFSITYKGFRIPCQVSFAEDYGIDKTFEFTFQAQAKIKAKFTLALETYFPVLDPTTVRRNNNRMDGGYNNNGPWATAIPSADTKIIFSFNSPIYGEKYFSGGLLPISWTSTGPVNRIDLYYRFVNTEDWQVITKAYLNTGEYDWQIPYFDSTGKIKTYSSTVCTIVTSTGSGADLRAIVDETGGIEKIVVIKPGSGYGHIENILVSPYPVSNLPGFVQPVIQATTVDGSVVGANIVSPGSGFVTLGPVQIEIKIVETQDPASYKILDNSLEFTGNIDSTLPSPANTKITNVMPTVVNLLLDVPLVGQGLSGLGMPEGTVIIAADPILNTVTISNPLLDIAQNENFQLSKYPVKISIQ